MLFCKTKIITLAEHTFNRLVDQRDNSIFIRVLRCIIRVHPYLNFLYEYRKGNIRKALKLSRKFKAKTMQQQKIIERTRELSNILESGWPIIKPKPLPSRQLNSKILFALHNSLPWDGAGYAIRSHQIIKHLQSHGLNITSVTRPGYPWDLNQHKKKPGSDHDMVDGVEYSRLQGQGLSLGGLERQYIKGYSSILSSLAIKKNINIIHAHSNYLNGMAATLAAHQSGCVGIYETRGLWHMSRAVMEPGFEHTDLYNYCHTMEIAAACQAHKVIAISEALKEYLADNGVDITRINVVPNAVDANHFRPAPYDADLGTSLGLKNRIVVGFMGSLTEYEGIDLIIRSVSSLISQGFNISLVIVGSGYAEKKLKKIAWSSPGRQHIHFIGRVPFEQVKRYYSIMDILPFPRKDFPVCRLVPPLKILEGMAMEKSVIISDLPPLREIIRQDDTGIVCKKDSMESLSRAIKNLAQSDRLRYKMSASAGKWVRKERSWDQVSRKYFEVYAMSRGQEAELRDQRAEIRGKRKAGSGKQEGVRRH